ncbi:MAG TPA: hypothetical protein VGS58_04970, partial [Candidatus Sulfopaludibacter sp.]|nr:hypothetical protein [Candidatus Sulfopaludibacter sp.]
MKSKVSYAVAAILGGVSLRALAAQPAPDPGAAETTVAAPQAASGDASSNAGTAPASLNEVIVTATRRSENIQSVPI